MEGRATVVVGVDGSTGSRAALEYAVEDAVRRGGGVQVYAVFPPPEYWANEWGVPALQVSVDIAADLQERTRNLVVSVVDGRPALAAVPVDVHAVAGSVGRVLVERSRSADLLVVGHRGHGAVGSVLLGSVGLHCVLHAGCPVVVVPPVAEELAAEEHSAKRRESVAERVADAAAAPMY
jgi:nucleotide-binding universal stress UspA family protein